ncbi:MAG: hypothetical protein Q7S59_11275 [Sulfurimonas sp.]|nr:hypothetical protein [Sulfurimonas sp.]
METKGIVISIVGIGISVYIFIISNQNEAFKNTVTENTSNIAKNIASIEKLNEDVKTISKNMISEDLSKNQEILQEHSKKLELIHETLIKLNQAQ